jgi:hypothetical protein
MTMSHEISNILKQPEAGKITAKTRLFGAKIGPQH